MVVLGSREQLCIHEKVRSLHGKAQTNACHALCKKRKKHYCAHFSRVSGNNLNFKFGIAKAFDHISIALKRIGYAALSFL